MIAGVAEAGVDLENVVVFSHGTTVATNALLTRQFPPAAMVTTKGFRDIIEIRRGTKDDLWDAYKDVAPPYIRRRDRLEVVERVDETGRVVEPLDEVQARRVAEVLRRRGVATVAVCFINSYANPANERRMKEILEESCPRLPSRRRARSCRRSSSTNASPRLLRRSRRSSPATPGASAHASSSPAIEEISSFSTRAAAMTPRAVEQLAVRLAASGIAAVRSRPGTSPRCAGTRTPLVSTWAGRAPTSRSSMGVSFGSRGSGSSSTATRSASRRSRCSIGAGAARSPGSTKRDRSAAVRSRRAPIRAPPPTDAGVEPTNTDANLHLGRLGEELIGGAMTLDRTSAEQAIRERIAGPLSLSTDEAALAIVQVANANMADAVRLISIRRVRPA